MSKSHKESTGVSRGKPTKEESEPIKARAATIYLLMRQGMRAKDAWKKAYPRTKANPRNWARMALRDYQWYEEKFAEDAKTMMKLCGLDPFRITQKVVELMDAERCVGYYRGYEKDEPPVMVPDRHVQVRAADLAANMWGMKSPEVTDAMEILTKWQATIPVILSILGQYPEAQTQVLKALEEIDSGAFKN